MQKSAAISERGGDVSHRNLGRAVQQEVSSNHKAIALARMALLIRLMCLVHADVHRAVCPRNARKWYCKVVKWAKNHRSFGDTV